MSGETHTRTCAWKGKRVRGRHGGDFADAVAYGYCSRTPETVGALYMAWSKLGENSRLAEAGSGGQWWQCPHKKLKTDSSWVFLVDSLFKCSACYSSFLNDEPLTPAPPPPFVLLALLFLCNINCPWGRVSAWLKLIPTWVAHDLLVLPP